MEVESLEQYKKKVQDQIESFKSIFAKASLGDYSENAIIPEGDDEFAELATGIQVMIEVVRERLEELEAEVAERKIAEERNKYQALHDELTGLPNRKLLDAQLQELCISAFQAKKKMAIMYLDLDRFKQVNDVFGHQIGDVLLKEFAIRIQGCLPKENLFARLGGDEFMIVLTNVHTKNDVLRVVKKINEALEFPIATESKTIFISTSIGISMFPAEGRDLRTLFANSDVALLQAKYAGRNHYRFYRPAMNKEASVRLDIVQELRRAALANEMETFYQPIVSTETNQIMNVEALLRWKHPKRGIITASEFIPIAYDHGIMRILGENALVSVFKAQRLWQRQGMPRIRVAVNLSAREFTDRGFVEKLKRLLDQYEIAPSLLEFEIVESLAMENIHLARDRFKAFHKLGISIAIDDFGIGHSSLSYLKGLPVDTLKIDQSFVKHSTTSKEDRAIIQTIVSLGHNLNLKVIAEGIESKDQRKTLEELGCDGLQGFRIARPMSGDALARWVSRSEPMV